MRRNRFLAVRRLLTQYSLPCPRPVVGKAEKLEGACPLPLRRAGGGLTERTQRRLLWMNGQPQARKALGQRGHEPAGIGLQLATEDKIIPVANQKAAPVQPGFDRVHVPLI